ncbi:DUF4034 domain-containing protein [Pectobacterium parmentieri]|uniref:DUF4034 domain-containing protein n=1 Tax=Pectobacterium parmentieri TaxID=1905730 RepID=A0A0H3I4C8_PECPM|nr:DUF4034 domain-containing protein [Pectobacterium parmentieri]AFI88715.1 Sel1 repeat family protein [Pectobacterium parmentieri]MBI0472566.1 DUF4034 domain-containing protein [Pectobacterium parmentieri]MBI0495245.1 DUF4034 domain-containing protein [Pectobacterium parmentieri]MBI0556539.1 DUF4034 domain-containing protein [Pectobacterium parmentieri]MBI0569710.1 DUF4034 domain-containing protein [Pectobacterium parmentieri]
MTSISESLTALVKSRAQLREMFATHQFDTLDALLEQEHQIWLDGPNLLYTYNWHMNSIFDPAVSHADILSHLQAWVAARPESYHAHHLTGQYWENAAARIRTSNGGQYVEDDRWMGAELARDLGVAAYLRASALHQRPALTFSRLFRLTCYLGEPQWLGVLLQGGDPLTYAQRQAQVEPELWEAGLQHLRNEGEQALVELPVALPTPLPARKTHEWEEPMHYWLRVTLATRPQDVAIRKECVYFLYPRWGGSHEIMAQFIDGPLCETLTESERNSLRVTQCWDYIGYDSLLPDAQDTESVAYCRKTFDRLLALELDVDERAKVLRKYASFLSHYARTEEGDEIHWNKVDMQKAYDLMVEAWQVDHPESHPDEGALDTLISCVNFASIEDRFNLMPKFLERCQAWADSAYETTIAAIASKFGFYGIAQGQFDSDALLARCSTLESDVNFGQAAANLFESVSEEAGVFLLHEAASWGEASSMATLSDLYSGHLSRRNGRDPSPYEDRDNAKYWQEKAADAGNEICQYNIAYGLVRDNETLTPEQYLRARELMLGVLHRPNVGRIVWTRAARELSSLLLFSDIVEDQQFCLDAVLPELWNDEDDANRDYAAGYYAHAFRNGAGVAQNSYLAKVWIDRALEITPDSQYNHDRANEIYQRSGMLGGVRAKMGFNRDKARIDARGRAITFGDNADREHQ